jgi:hypothetical protein
MSDYDSGWCHGREELEPELARLRAEADRLRALLRRGIALASFARDVPQLEDEAGRWLEEAEAATGSRSTSDQPKEGA